MPRLAEGQFRASCEVCDKRFNCWGLVGGHTICNKCSNPISQDFPFNFFEVVSV